MPTVYITAPREDGKELATHLVTTQLAACVNVIECESVYWWDGSVVEDDEVVLFAKTTETAYEALVKEVEAEHPYDVPCIERFDESAILDSFARWRANAVDSSK